VEEGVPPKFARAPPVGCGWRCAASEGWQRGKDGNLAAPRKKILVPPLAVIIIIVSIYTNAVHWSTGVYDDVGHSLTRRQKNGNLLLDKLSLRC